MTRKLGPLPVWAWGMIFGVLGYFLYERYKAGQNATAATNGPSILDPNAVDPNTGLTYGQEEAAAMNADAALNAGLGGSGGVGATTTESGAQGSLPSTNEFTDFLSFLQDWNAFSQTLGWESPTQVAASVTAAQAAASPPVQASSPPTTTPAANTSPGLKLNAALHTPTGISGGSAQAFLKGILGGKQPYTKISGTTQKGGLPQTGTYIKKGSNIKYYAFSQGGVLHVRQAT